MDTATLVIGGALITIDLRRHNICIYYNAENLYDSKSLQRMRLNLTTCLCMLKHERIAFVGVKVAMISGWQGCGIWCWRCVFSSRFASLAPSPFYNFVQDLSLFVYWRALVHMATNPIRAAKQKTKKIKKHRNVEDLWFYQGSCWVTAFSLRRVSVLQMGP